ncbi:MAG: ATP-binding protein [Dehalococcoidales bacterium]|nr:ATP-binding protein [Dehalococcoidales bacterium]
MNRLSWKLTGAILMVVVICIGFMVYMVNLITTSEFSQYINQSNMARVQQIAENLSDFYKQEQKWAGVDNIIDELLWSGNSRIVVADNSGLIVGDTDDNWLGQYADDIALSNGTSITVSGKEVGEVFVVASMYRHGHSANAMTVIPLDTTQQDFLNQVNRSIWLAAVIGVAVAFLLGFLLTQYLIKPIKALGRGASHIAGGNLKYRVKVGSRDEIGELAQTFNSMASKLEMNEQMRQQLMADIAHELRTPLTVIGGTVDGMMDGIFPTNSERLGTIKEQTVLLTRLIGDLRDISLAETGQLKLEKTSTDVFELAKRTLSKFEAASKEKNINLLIKGPSELPQLSIDPFRIEQVINNLLTNALRHTPAGGSISISMDMRNRSQQFDKKHILISVADTGEGISPEHLAHIFDRFYRVKSARSRSDGGTGLGLAIASQMVQAHGGRLWVESAQGKGSTFYIALPVNSPEIR